MKSERLMGFLGCAGLANKGVFDDNRAREGSAMGLWARLCTLAGDFHAVKAWAFPPCFLLGEHRKRGDFALDYRAASKLLEPGDILTSRQWGYVLSNRAIPGAFKHAALYAGPVSGWRDPETGFIEKPRILPSGIGISQTMNPRAVIHSISDGVVAEDFLSFLAKEDYVAAYRPVGPTLSHQRMVAEACKHVGSPYNFSFGETRPGKFYCSEFINYLCDRVGIQNPPKTQLRLKVVGPKSYVPLADSYAVTHKMIWCTVSCNEPSFANRSLIPDVLRARIYEAEDGNSLYGRH